MNKHDIHRDGEHSESPSPGGRRSPVSQPASPVENEAQNLRRTLSSPTDNNQTQVDTHFQNHMSNRNRMVNPTPSPTNSLLSAKSWQSLPESGRFDFSEAKVTDSPLGRSISPGFSPGSPFGKLSGSPRVGRRGNKHGKSKSPMRSSPLRDALDLASPRGVGGKLEGTVTQKTGKERSESKKSESKEGRKASKEGLRSGSKESQSKEGKKQSESEESFSKGEESPSKSPSKGQSVLRKTPAKAIGFGSSEARKRPEAFGGGIVERSPSVPRSITRSFVGENAS
jgi:hypothetical protein